MARKQAAQIDNTPPASESAPITPQPVAQAVDSVIAALAALSDENRLSVVSAMLAGMTPDAIRAILPESVVNAIQNAAKARKRDSWQADLDSAVASFADGDGKTFAAWRTALPAHLFLCGPSGRPRDAEPGSRLYLISKHAPDDFAPVMVCDVLADTTRRNGKLFKRVPA
jgi:hypothetical protein